MYSVSWCVDNESRSGKMTSRYCAMRDKRRPLCRGDLAAAVRMGRRNKN